MRNLIVETQSTTVFDDHVLLPRSQYHCCYDFNKNIFYLVECHANVIHIMDVAKEIYSTKKIALKFDRINTIGVEYCSNNGDIYVGYDSGFVYELKEFDEILLEAVEVAEFPTGLQCMKISPDNEVIVFVSKDLVVTVITCRFFDCVNSASLLCTEFGAKEFITVGWGKKETQFHGSMGKAAAKETPGEFRKSNADKGIPKITWNTSSTLFAVSFVDPKINARRFKVFDRKGILQYTSELVDGLEGTLSWKTADNVIAATRILPNKHTVALFNKNGLLHREFALPYDSQTVQILDLIWSRDSDILGIWYRDLITKLNIVQLWSQSNYHWYLKQTIKYPEKYPILYVAWHSQIDKDLLILSLKSSTAYRFYWAISQSCGKTESDKATVCVIDGNDVNKTKFKESMYPPPMCQRKYQFKVPVNAVLFSPNGWNNEEDPNDFLVFLSNNKIIVCKNNEMLSDGEEPTYKTYNFSLSIKNGYRYSFSLMQHLFWYKKNVVLFSITLGTKSTLYELPLLDFNDLDVIELEPRRIQEMSGKIQHIVASSDSKTAYVIVDNKVYRYNDRDGVEKSELTISKKASHVVAKVECANFGGKEVIIALTRNHILYVNGNQITNNVTSFYLHSEALFITTQQHTLIHFDLSSNGLDQLMTKDLTVQPWEQKSNVQELNIRRVERGSVIIAVIAKGDRMILQMPRGNLEIIQHRTLTISIIKPLLDQQNYKQALEIMRKQQIDYNLFYDHNPQSFLHNIKKFADDLDARNLTIFLTDLNDDDVTRTIYKSNYVDRTTTKAASSSKVELTCEILRAAMEKNHDKLIEPIIVSLVKKESVKGIEEAIIKLQRLSECAMSSSAEEKLRRLTFLVKKRNLFDIALGTYDLKLAMFVAEATHTLSQENVNFLNSFKMLEPNYMKYKIDVHLKRYESALTNIAKLPERFDECRKLIREHGLYAQGLKLFAETRSTPEYADIATIYAEVLDGKGKHREAGILYSKANELSKALVAFKKANSWQDAIATAFKLKLSAAELKDLYVESVERLQRDNKYNDAAIILSKYLNRFEEAVAMLCMGKEWLRAWNEVCCNDRLDLIESRVRPSVIDHAEFLLGHLRHCRENFGAHASRLVLVRPELLKRRETLAELGSLVIGEPGEAMAGGCGTESIADSMDTRTSRASRSTYRTYRSSKNRRKHERKMFSTKKGSLYEDFGLVLALHQLVTQAYEQRNDVRTVAEVLLYINSDKLAEDLQKEMNVFLAEISKQKHVIWPPIRENTNFRANFVEDLGDEKQMWTEPYLLFAPVEKPSDWKLDIFSLS